jgi:hypothetical protein
MTHITNAPDGRKHQKIDLHIKSGRKLGGLSGDVDTSMQYHAQDNGATPEQLRQQGFILAPEVRARRADLRDTPIWKRPAGSTGVSKYNTRLGV